MNLTFNKLPEEKKYALIKICIDEFAIKGYENTSTDVITAKAGISKGILFHYFKSKKNLYLFIVDYVREQLSHKTIAEVEKIHEDDFFNRIKAVSLAKQRIFMEYPMESELLLSSYTNPPLTVKEELKEMYQQHIKEYTKFNIEAHIYMKELLCRDKLKSNISKERVIKTTMFILEQLSNKYMTMYKNNQFDMINNQELMLKEIDEYIDIIKYGVYKPEA